MRYLIIAVGAALGANARYLVGIWAAGRWGIDFPYGTLLVNLVGSFVLGFLLAAGTSRLAIAAELRLFLAVGFLGSFTTFSSYTVESIALLQAGNWGAGLLNMAANNLAGSACAVVGMVLGRALA